MPPVFSFEFPRALHPRRQDFQLKLPVLLPPAAAAGILKHSSLPTPGFSFEIPSASAPVAGIFISNSRCPAAPGELDVCIFTCPTAPGELDVCIFTRPAAPGELDVCIFTCPAAPGLIAFFKESCLGFHEPKSAVHAHPLTPLLIYPAALFKKSCFGLN